MSTQIRKVHNDPSKSMDLQTHEIQTKFNTHSALQADPTDTDTDIEKHVSNAQTKVWQDHSESTGNPHGTDHDELEAIEQADDSSADEAGGKHVTDALVKKYEDHRIDSTIHHTLEEIQDDIAAMLVEGNAVTLTYDDGAGTLTIAVTQLAASADATTTVTGTAGVLYTATEKDMINALSVDVQAIKDSLNDLKGKMRDADLLSA